MATRNLTLALLVFVLTACGGGGSELAPAPSPTAPPPAPTLVVAYGDSTQEAQGKPHGAQRPGFVIENKGIGGSNTTDLLVGWSAEMAAQPAKIVVINHGMNDRRAGDTVEKYRENLRRLVEVAQAAGKVVILEEPNRVGEVETPVMASVNFDVPFFEERRAAMKLMASHLGVYFCEQPRVPLLDGIHPNAEGLALKANRLALCIADVL